MIDQKHESGVGKEACDAKPRGNILHNRGGYRGNKCNRSDQFNGPPKSLRVTGNVKANKQDEGSCDAIDPNFLVKNPMETGRAFGALAQVHTEGNCKQGGADGLRVESDLVDRDSGQIYTKK